jgi:hypothetical protein
MRKNQMMTFTPEEQLDRIKQHTVQIVPEAELLNRLRERRPLTLKLGSIRADPISTWVTLSY